MATEGTFTKLKCPECGKELLTDGDLVWCSNVGSQYRASCPFGVLCHVKLSEFREGLKTSGGT